LEMDGLIDKYSAIMDQYDPQKKVALVVDEWGSWYAPLPGSRETMTCIEDARGGVKEPSASGGMRIHSAQREA